MIGRAGIGQWSDQASARALHLPGGPLLTSETGSDRLSPDQLFGGGGSTGWCLRSGLAGRIAQHLGRGAR